MRPITAIDFYPLLTFWSGSHGTKPLTEHEYSPWNCLHPSIMRLQEQARTGYHSPHSIARNRATRADSVYAVGLTVTVQQGSLLKAAITFLSFAVNFINRLIFVTKIVDCLLLSKNWKATLFT